MKLVVTILLGVLLLGGGYLLLTAENKAASDKVMTDNKTAIENQIQEEKTAPVINTPIVTPISHATMILSWGAVTIYTDPVGDASLYKDHPAPDVVLLTDIHGDHFSVETIENLITTETIIIAPQAVFEALSLELQSRTQMLANNEMVEIEDLVVTGIPMYNLPENDPDSRHQKGRGNGYVIEDEEYRVYIAGDTEDVPEMRRLVDVDMAFIPMNPPYTMSVDAAAAGVLAFAPKQVYPYHFRTPDGFSDVSRFKDLVDAENSEIEVVLLDWYPDTEEDGV